MTLDCAKEKSEKQRVSDQTWIPAEDEVDHDVDTDDLLSNEEDDNESGFLSQL